MVVSAEAAIGILKAGCAGFKVTGVNFNFVAALLSNG